MLLLLNVMRFVLFYALLQKCVEFFHYRGFTTGYIYLECLIKINDIKAGLVSINSPVARGLIGKREGDTVVVQVPSGAVEYEILAVLYL